MSDSLYRDHLLDHYYSPRNYGLRDGFDIEARGANPLCGDSLTVRLKVTEGRISDVCFESEGCVVNRAAASMLFERIKGRTKNEARAVSAEEMLSLLGVDIMPARLKCALLALEAIKSAV